MRQFLLYTALLLLVQCSKCKDNDPSPEAQLPPATQTGANTFGCLVNGEPFTPAGRVGLGSNLYFEYDPTFNGGTFVVQAYRVGDGRKQYVTLTAVPVSGPGTYSFALPDTVAEAAYFDSQLVRPCNDVATDYPDVYRKGTLTLTHVDYSTGIIAGTFEVKFVRTGGCDTVRFTKGRFDVTF